MPKALTHILASDLLIVDVITPLEGNAALGKLVKEYGLLPGGKCALTRAQFDEFSRAITGHPITVMPGGSSANTLTTLAKLLPTQVKATFLGVVGKSFYSSMIRQSLDDAKVVLTPEKLIIPDGHTPQAAVSYVMVLPDGERIIATYPGNARDLLTPDMITEELVAAQDVIFLQGSLWQKMTWEFADRLDDLRWKLDKELWLAMPTHARFGEEKADLFRWLIPGTHTVLGNDEEIARIYGTGSNIDAALKKLQEAFREDALKNHGKKPRPQVGFVTCGRKGGVIVTAERIAPVSPPGVPQEAIVNKVGAGDTAFAGFLAGQLMGKSAEESAAIAMKLAGEKLKVNAPRLAEPKAFVSF